MADDTPYDVGRIVESYIHAKLLRKGLKWESQTGFSDSSHPGNGLGERVSSSCSSSSSSGSDSTRQRSHILPPDAEEAPPAPGRGARLQSALREAGEDMERLYQRDFEEMSGQLHFTPSTARRRFTAVADQLFLDGVNWGRIVAFLEFGGTMCVESLEREMAAQVDNIARWMTDSLNAPPLRPWIEENGGWDAFVELYGARHRGSVLRHRSSLKTIFGLAALGAAGVTIGALFSQK